MPDMRFWNDDTTEEEIRTSLRDYINRLAPGGGYAMMDYIYADPAPDAPEAAKNRNRWLREEFESLKFSFYD
jgi:hypothetical protein